jgi:hypothetical protein
MAKILKIGPKLEFLEPNYDFCPPPSPGAKMTLKNGVEISNRQKQFGGSKNPKMRKVLSWVYILRLCENSGEKSRFWRFFDILIFKTRTKMPSGPF